MTVQQIKGKGISIVSGSQGSYTVAIAADLSHESKSCIEVRAKVCEGAEGRAEK